MEVVTKFAQVLENASVAEMYEGHLAALEHLAAHGIQRRQVADSDYEETFRRAVADARKALRSSIVAIPHFLWRAITGDIRGTA